MTKKQQCHFLLKKDSRDNGAQRLWEWGWEEDGNLRVGYSSLIVTLIHFTDIKGKIMFYLSFKMKEGQLGAQEDPSVIS